MSQFNSLFVLSGLVKPLADEPAVIIQLNALAATRINNDIAVAIQGIEAEEQQSLTVQKCTWSG